MTKPIARRRAPATRAKVTVTIPNDVLAAALDNVKVRRAPSLSAYVSQALAEKVAIDKGEDEYLDWLKQLDEELGEPSAEAYEWASKLLEP